MRIRNQIYNDERNRKLVIVYFGIILYHDMTLLHIYTKYSFLVF